LCGILILYFVYFFPPSFRHLLYNLPTYNLFIQNLFIYNLLTHNLHTYNVITHNLFTYNLFIYNLSTHNIFTYNFYIHNLLTYNLLTNNLHTHNLLIIYSYITYTHTMALCVALRDRWGMYGTGLALVAYLGFRCRHGRRGFLRDRYGTWNCDLIFTFILYGRYGTHIFWVIWIVFLRGRCDMYGVGLALVTYLNLKCRRGRRGFFVWQAWSLELHFDIYIHFVWQVWYFASQAWYLATCSCTLLALVACLGLRCRRGRRGILRGKRGTWKYPPSFHVVCVVFDNIDWIYTFVILHVLLHTL
jgi:hypothetical protein